MSASTTESEGKPASRRPGSPSRFFVIAYYALLVLVTGVVVVIAATTGSRKHAQPALAGGYDVSAGATCLGPTFDLQQSGQFVDLSNVQGTVGGGLTFKHGSLTGTAKCVNQAKAPVRARFSNGNLLGTVGGVALAAQLKRDPPPAGTPRPRSPGSIAGTYGLAPSSACLGTTVDVTRSGSRYEVVTGQVKRGTVSYHK